MFDIKDEVRSYGSYKKFNQRMTPKLWILVGLVVASVTFTAWVVFIAVMFVKAYG